MGTSWENDGTSKENYGNITRWKIIGQSLKMIENYYNNPTYGKNNGKIIGT